MNVDGSTRRTQDAAALLDHDLSKLFAQIASGGLRWALEHLLETVQQRLDANPQSMRQRLETVEHPFGSIKTCMGATHFLTKTLPKVAAEMALSVLAYNLTRVMNIVGIKQLMAAIVA
jgi:Transposase DDE domain